MVNFTKTQEMKILYYFIFFIIVFACKTNQNTSEESGGHLKDISCPDDGNCSFEVIENSSLELKLDEFGKLYPVIGPGEKTVIKFRYDKKVDPKIMDGNYAELVYMEVNKNEPRLILKDMELQNTKMVFGRLCHCRDTSGYFRVSQGELYLYNYNGKLQMNLEFEVKRIPQVISKINESINY